MILDKAPLGKTVGYLKTYSPEILYPVPRSLQRDNLKCRDFKGYDLWRGWELSWLNPKGKPVVASAEFHFPCNTPNLVESKSFKLYLNSFNQTSFASFDAVRAAMEKDLSECAGGPVGIKLFSLEEPQPSLPFKLIGDCLDSLDIETDIYEVDPKLLKTSPQIVEETLYSRLLKSNCLATGQPDWGIFYIHYKGPKIDRASLLKYIISFRDHSGFAEHCVERMLSDITVECAPEKLCVATAYTRRGGLDINPVRIC